MSTPTARNQIQQWMVDTANNRRPAVKLIFDKTTKRLIPVQPNDPRADQALPFTTEEAKRFGSQGPTPLEPTRLDASWTEVR